MAGAAETRLDPRLDPRIVAGSDYGNPDPEWQQIDWAAARRRLRLPGAQVNYVELGEGDPILFVHGISGCWQNWLENLPRFSRSHRVVALDLPGFGASPMPSWPIDMPTYGRLLHDFCEELGLERATVVGNSMGGLLATEVVTSWPGRFERLVLVSAAGIINTWSPQLRATVTAWAWQEFGPRFGQWRRGIVGRPRAREIVFRPFVRYPRRLRQDLLAAQMEGGLTESEGFGDALRGLIGYDARERLGEISVPTMIVWGLSDQVIPAAAAASYHRRIPDSRLEIFERTGHVPQLERPLRFNLLLEEFLAS